MDVDQFFKSIISLPAEQLQQAPGPWPGWLLGCLVPLPEFAHSHTSSTEHCHHWQCGPYHFLQNIYNTLKI